jgi:hypothetical protein
MERISTYNDFITEAIQDELKQITCAVSPAQRYVDLEQHHSKKNRYFKLFTKEHDPKSVSGPVLNYCNDQTKRLMKAGYSDKNIYNKYDAKMGVASKKDWHELHRESEYVPKTVTDPKYLRQLNFPIIAKPDNEHSGLGIVKFDKIKDCSKTDLTKFTVFNEKIDIKEEHRIFTWRDQPLMWVQRVAANDDTKNMTKKSNDKLKFNYVLKRKTLPDNWLEVFKEFHDKHQDLDIYSLDIAVDQDNKPWVIEMSSEPGVPYGVMGLYYKEIYKDYYNKPLSKGAEAKIDEYIELDIKKTVDLDPKRFTVES